MHCIGCLEKKEKDQMADDELCLKCYNQLMALYKRKNGRVVQKRIRRVCLKCGRSFWSEGKHNRLCNDCNCYNKSVKSPSILSSYCCK